MIHLAHKFAPLGWNKRVFTEEDFVRLCRKERVRVFDIPLRVPGFYLASGGKRCIYLDNRLRGARRLHTGLHELAHHYLHVGAEPTAALFFRLRPNTKEEHEAEVFACVAVIPEPRLRRMVNTAEVEWEHGYTGEMLNFRLKILELYGV